MCDGRTPEVNATVSMPMCPRSVFTMPNCSENMFEKMSATETGATT